ncbi:MAG: hypothetical protein A2V79_11715 [Betaproteobacteria bacterium RBG_16_56_24]|nr:MAG: hypothetical protein A2V79_11715 [Betaproteobacteria bacterium RBG_16_56_24]
MLTQERLKELLSYDSATGLFARMVSGHGVKVGDAAGTLCKGYIQIKINRRKYYAHRLAWLYVYGELPTHDTDHINMDRADNRIANLRLATRSENNFNTGKQANNTSGFRGVSWKNTSKKWCAEARLNGEHHHLGYFTTPEEADVAYRAFVQRHHGEFLYQGDTA